MTKQRLQTYIISNNNAHEKLHNENSLRRIYVYHGSKFGANDLPMRAYNIHTHTFHSIHFAMRRARMHNRAVI